MAAAAEPLEVLPDVVVPVATVPHLLALKVLARDDRLRPQDRADAVALVGATDAGGLGEARAALALIRDRGYGRERELLGEFDRLLEELA